jgi:hypothetical protein
LTGTKAVKLIASLVIEDYKIKYACLFPSKTFASPFHCLSAPTAGNLQSRLNKRENEKKKSMRNLSKLFMRR